MNRGELVKVLNLASGALSSTDFVPIYKCFAFNGKTVTAYNDLIGVTAPCVTGDEFVVHGGTLLGLLENSSAEDMAFTLDGNTNDVTIKSGRSTFRLPFYPLEDYIFVDPDLNQSIDLDLNTQFLDGLRACLKTSSRDNSQPAFLGVALQGNRLFSSDSDAISEYILDAKNKAKEQYMLPNEFCELLIKITDELPEGDGIIHVNNDWVMAELPGGYSVFARVIQNSAPVDFAKEIKKTMRGNGDFKATPEGLKEALLRARVVADRETAKTELKVEKGRLKLLTETSMGIVRDSLPFADHPDVVAHVNAALMQRSLELTDRIVIDEGYCAFQSDVLLVLTGNME